MIGHDAMNLGALQSAFRAGYYRFSASEWDAELASNFSRLRRFRSGFADRALEMFSGLNPEEQHDLAAGFLSRGHPEASSQLGVGLTARQTALLHRREADHRVPTEAPELTAGPRLRSAQLAKIVKEKLRGLGAAEEVGSRSLWRYRTPCGQFTILTHLDVGGRIWNLSYHHDVLLGQVRLQRFISFLSWLGVGASKWTLQSEDEAVEAVDLLHDLCLHLLAAAPEILP